MNEESIFATALEKHSAAERQAYLEQACQGDAALRAQVEELLKASDDAGSFLGAAAIGTDATVPPTIQSGTFAGSGQWAASLPFLEPLTKPDRLGKLGHYEVIEVVGHGGMGAVLRAFDTKLSRVVAVKVMAPELAANPTAVKRFQREASAAAQVHHDHVVTIHAVEESHRPPYLVMQFIEGQTLQQKIDREGALPLMQILRIGSQMAHGLEAAHKLGLIHRDVKPANVLLENGVERVKITDFGLARAADDMEMTQAGMIAGTPQYMSPEQAKGDVIDTRSDLFSLGSVLYTMCTGRPAFRAETTLGVLRRVCEDAPRPIREVNAEIPAWLEAIVNKLLAKQPDDRIQTATEVGDLLGQHLAHLQNPSQVARPAMVFPVPEPKYPVGGKRPGWKLPALLMIIAAVILSLPLVLAGMIVASWFFHHSQSKPSSGVIITELQHPAMTGPWKTIDELEAKGVSADGWVSLFDGATLDGWRAVPPQNWWIEDGVIHGTGSDGFLLSEINDLEDFHLRVEFRINQSGDSGVHFRMPPPRHDGTRWGVHSVGLEAEIGVGNASGYRTGGLSAPSRLLAAGLEAVHPAAEWTTLEIVARQKRIQIIVSGRVVTDVSDDEHRFRRGHIALTSWENVNVKTHVEFRKVEVRKLPGNSIHTGGPAFPAGSTADIVTSPDWHWTEAESLGPAVNSAHMDYLPCLSSDGLTLIFSSPRPGGLGRLDLWTCTRKSQQDDWSPAKNLGAEINSASLESTCCLAADGHTLLFSSDRPGSAGGRDLWSSTWSIEEQKWLPAVPLAAPINTAADESSPSLSADGLSLYFASDRFAGSHDLWVSTRQSPGAAWQTPTVLGPEVNSSAYEAGVSLSGDGLTLLFSRSVSSPAQKISGFETWVSVRPAADRPWLPAVRMRRLGGGASISADGQSFITNLASPGGDDSNDLFLVRRVPRDGTRRAATVALRELVAAKQQSLETVKAQFDAGKVAAQDLTAAEVELIEARIRLAEADDPPAVVGLYQELIAKLTEQRGIVKQLFDSGVVSVSKLYDEDGRLADARARLAQAQGVPRAVAPFDSAQARSLQEAWAKHLGVPVEITNGVGMRLSLIPPGEFVMGTTQADLEKVIRDVHSSNDPAFFEKLKGELGQRQATIHAPYYLGQHEVTVGQFRRFVEATGHVTDAETSGDGGWSSREGRWVRHKDHTWRTPGEWRPTDDQPVVQISHRDAMAFLDWLSRKEGRQYRLPTQMEWEFAARAGTQRLFGDSDDPRTVDEIAWSRYSLPADRPGQPQPVGGKKPNALGVFDMAGNVWEWTNTFRPANHVICGGAWYCEADQVRPASIGTAIPTMAWDAGTGFRVAIVGDLKAD